MIDARHKRRSGAVSGWLQELAVNRRIAGRAWASGRWKTMPIGRKGKDE